LYQVVLKIKMVDLIFNLTPFIPLSWRGVPQERGNIKKRGWHPSSQATPPGGGS
jgi:hypothetical protein